MNNVTIHPYLCQHLYSFGGIQGTRSLIDWIILACRESWPKERHLPGHVQHCKYVEKVQQSFREWRIRKAVYNFVTAGIKTKLFQSIPTTWSGTLIWCQAQSRDKTFITLANLLLILGKLTNPRNGHKLWETPETEKELKSQKSIPISCELSGKSYLEANMVWSHCCWDSTWTDKPATQHCVGQLVERLKTWKTVWVLLTCSYHTWCPSSSSRGLKGLVPFGMGVQDACPGWLQVMEWSTSFFSLLVFHVWNGASFRFHLGKLPRSQTNKYQVSLHYMQVQVLVSRTAVKRKCPWGSRSMGSNGT